MRNRFLIVVIVLFAAIRAEAQTPPPGRLFHTAIAVDVPADKYVYNWRDAVLLKSLIDIYRKHPDKREIVGQYTMEAMTRVASRAHGVHPNGMASAVGFAFLQEIGKNNELTDKALVKVMRDYQSQIRTENGASSHRVDKLEIWDDTLYMIGLPLIACFRATGDKEYLHLYAKEILAHSALLMDKKTGLWYHGWSETDLPYDDVCCQRAWNANPDHRNEEFWGRGNGWVAMSMVDLLEFLPKNDPSYCRIRKMFRKMFKQLSKLQDTDTGMWHQLPLYPEDNRNFLESSCTAMFGYAAAKGARLGLLPNRYTRIANRAYQGLVENCMVNNDDGTSYLSHICCGTCIGDREYYYSREFVTGGETYAIGAVLMLANELGKEF